jgi:signal transduction histidine kinase
MAKGINRRPIGNFFIKRALQVRMIKNIVLSAVISTIVSSSSLFLVYYLRYKTVVVYQLDQLTQNLSRENILTIIFPALLISAILSIILAFGIGLYSSRKYAVPIYKLEQWLALLLKGKIGAVLQFREKDEMKGLSDKCNTLGQEMQKAFFEVRAKIQSLKDQNVAPAIVRDLETILSKIEVDSDPIKVSTSFCTTTANAKEGES